MREREREREIVAVADEKGRRQSLRRGWRASLVAAAELRCSSSWLGLSGASLATPRHISWRRGCQPPAGKGGRVGWSWGEMESKYRQMSAPALTPPRHQSTASVGGREHMVLPSWSPDSADLHLDIYLSTYQYKRHSRAICLVLPWARWSRPTLSAIKHNIQMCKWVKQDTR